MQAQLDVLVIGAGFGGLGMGIQLALAGRRDFVIVERAAGVGGTWWANRYPGAACDIPSLLYSFSFAPRHDWSRHYPGQAEIADYLTECVQRFGLAPHLRLSTTVTALSWDESDGRWLVQARTAAAQTLQWKARVVVSASGGLSQPSLPSLPGLQDFRGLCCHTARWDDAIGHAGQRIGIVGSGASAVQLLPQLVARGAHVTLLQRTPPWVLPKGDHPIGRRRLWLRRRVPGWQRLERLAIYLKHEARAPGFTRYPRLLRTLEPRVLRYMEHRIPEGPLRDALTPRYRLGCKRILIADDFFPALRQPNARVVTSGIERVIADGVRTRDGERHSFDALVLATGFEAADALAPFEVTGRHGADLNARWTRQGARAYYGCALPDFPNFFMIIGPNTGLGHNSMIFMIESQLRFVMDALRQLDRRCADSLTVRREAFERFNAELQQRLSRTVWASGCHSWYRSSDGRITTLWPGSTLEFRRRTRRIDATAFEFISA
jgi:cation diffusion facilitator CzcD-associated flavoprotein CzcO